MSISYGLKPKFDVKDEPVYSNIKLIAEKAKKYEKIFKILGLDSINFCVLTI